MIGTIIDVVRGEGMAAALVRASERVAEAVSEAALQTRGWFAPRPAATIVNVAIGGIAPRQGGVAVQLMARLREERRLRSVALLSAASLRSSAPFAHTRRLGRLDFDAALRKALSITGARAVHFEGTSGLPLDNVFRLIDEGVVAIVSLHDFSLRTQPLEAGRRLLTAARHTIFPSTFLLDAYRELFVLPLAGASVIEPSGPIGKPARSEGGEGIAFAGAVKRHKGGHLLAEVAARLAANGLMLHVFGGGDSDLLRAVKRHGNAIVHGYYRAGRLPSLLARHHIGLVLIPSIVPEAFSLTLSEAWRAGAAVAAFDLGSQAERIRRNGGGWIAPLESGAAGLVEIVDRWRSGSEAVIVPAVDASPAGAARAHVDLYRRIGVLP